MQDGEAAETEATRERIATNIRKGVLEYCVLAVLADRDCYGLELAETLVDRGLSASEGSLYPLLARMRQTGAVETRWESSVGTRRRRYYTLTCHGHRQLGLFAQVWRDLRPQVDTLVRAAVVPDPTQEDRR